MADRAVNENMPQHFEVDEVDETEFLAHLQQLYMPGTDPSFWQGLRNARQHLSERPRSAGTLGLLLSAFVPLAYWQLLQVLGCPIDRRISDRLDRIEMNPHGTLGIDTRLASDPLQFGRVQRSDALVSGATGATTSSGGCNYLQLRRRPDAGREIDPRYRE